MPLRCPAPDICVWAPACLPLGLCHWLPGWPFLSLSLCLSLSLSLSLCISLSLSVSLSVSLCICLSPSPLVSTRRFHRNVAPDELGCLELSRLIHFTVKPVATSASSVHLFEAIPRSTGSHLGGGGGAGGGGGGNGGAAAAGNGGGRSNAANALALNPRYFVRMILRHSLSNAEEDFAAQERYTRSKQQFVN
eukprot:GHVU01078480.1.p2 GENE.GHVU01078480.1~~GHVU01078480.1.p2  ORF type:complete len:192 (+),score=18.58 GHVU01078480.1:91-666(+)